MTSSGIHLGYIGLGIMGSAMAVNLLKAGHRVTVWNRTASKADALVAAGAKPADSPAAVAGGGAEVVFINVTDTPDVERVLFGDRGVASGVKPGLIVVDHSTISPTATREFAERLSERGVDFLDAPVSGGDAGARAGTLSIMVGGEARVFERVRPIFARVGKAIVHVGGIGAGQACKACNQVNVVGNLMAACESLLLAEKLGLDARKMIEVVGAGAGGSWQLSNLGPKILAGDFAPGFRIDLVLKDLALIAEAARQTGLPLTATALAETFMRSVAANGGEKLGSQAMALALRRLAGMADAEHKV